MSKAPKKRFAFETKSDLKLNSEGVNVRALQTLLKTFGHLRGPYCPGDFCKRTERAVRVYQRYYGLKIDGVMVGMRYEYFEADCNVVADLQALDPVASGMTKTLDLGLRHREEHYGFRFRGLVRVPRDGMYRFHLSSDDGATFAIGDEMVVDHDGIHAAFEKHGDIALAAGLHPFEILFFEKGGDEALDLWIEGPEMNRRKVEGDMLFASPDR